MLTEYMDSGTAAGLIERLAKIDKAGNNARVGFGILCASAGLCPTCLTPWSSSGFCKCDIPRSGGAA